MIGFLNSCAAIFTNSSFILSDSLALSYSSVSRQRLSKIVTKAKTVGLLVESTARPIASANEALESSLVSTKNETLLSAMSILNLASGGVSILLTTMPLDLNMSSLSFMNSSSAVSILIFTPRSTAFFSSSMTPILCSRWMALIVGKTKKMSDDAVLITLRYC